MLKNSLFTFCIMWATLFLSAHADTQVDTQVDNQANTQSSAEQNTKSQWPQEIKTDKGVVIVYQPQPESLKDNRLKARAAVSIELKGSDKPVFGAIWFNAQLQIDRDDHTATIANVNITHVRIPEAGDKNLSKFKTLLEQEMPRWNLQISMAQILASVKLEDQRVNASKKINTAPPEIIFLEEPAILVSIDGEPKLQDVPQRSLKRIVNTPFTIIFSPTEKRYYLNADKKVWYTASDLTVDWSIAESVPRAISDLEPESPENESQKKTSEKADDLDKKSGPPPKIIIRTQPAELISTTGKAEFKPINGVQNLLYMSNTESDVLLEISQQKYYVLLAGRWYISDKMQGPWKYVAGESLPTDFAKIPEDSNMATVLYAVPGTDVAQAAVLDAQIPQTAAIDRSLANLTVEYDGEPIFKPILSTALSYAVNTAIPVIKVSHNLYYAVDNAVWFAATSPMGKWTIATSVPDEIYTIPADSPMYNITFVKIYKAEPQVVYVGYTPGYTYTYIYGSTIVYGTGYYYPGWYHHHIYYPYPATWGYHARWNPYMGWGLGVSYSTGPFTFTMGYGGWYHGGWWGPYHYYGYRRAYYHGYRRGIHSGYRPVIQPVTRPVNRPGHKPSHKPSHKPGGTPVKQPRPGTQNLYKNPRNVARTAPATGQPKARPATDRANNIYTDQQGNLHRKTGDGWQSRSNNGWQSQRPSQKPAQRPTQQPSQRPSQRPSTYNRGGNNQQQLQRSYQSRQQGMQRNQQFNQIRGNASRGGARRR